MKSWITLSLTVILALSVSVVSAEEKSCPNTTLKCNCSDSPKLLRAATNNDATHIEKLDIEKLSIGDQCRSSIMEKLAIGGIEIGDVFKNVNSASQYSKTAFLNFANGSGFKAAYKKFPVSSKDIADPNVSGNTGVCLPDGIQPSQAIVAGSKIPITRIPKSQDMDGIWRVDTGKMKSTRCLIYLPKPYVSAAAGNSHRELYPHDSSYVISTLIDRNADGDLTLAKGMIDDMIFEAKHFGYPLNGNRGYFLTRSQNNTLMTNIWEYARISDDVTWLENEALPVALRVIDYWNTRIGVINLSGEKEIETAGDVEGNRWMAHGIGPCQEIWESHEARGYYYYRILENLIELALTPNPKRPDYAKNFDYNRVVFVASNNHLEIWKKKNALVEFPGTIEGLKGKPYILKGSVSLSERDEPAIEINGTFYTLMPKYYSNDRAQRTSGYNTNHLYGPFNSFTDEFVDATLNIQLYRAYVDVAKMYGRLAKQYDGRDKKKSKTYLEKVELYESEAKQKKDMILKFLWDDKLGMIFNYSNYIHKRRVNYPFASGGYVIWAELFDITIPEERTKLFRLVDYMSKHLEGPDGYFASAIETGLPWDKPHVWPTHQGMIVAGMRHYIDQLRGLKMKNEAAKLERVADRIALKYLMANYDDWLASKGQKAAEKVDPAGETIRTGYGSGADYAWNLAAIWDLHAGLSKKAQTIFNTYTTTRTLPNK